MNRTDNIEATLRSLDVADQHVDTSTERARSDLNTILSTETEPTRDEGSAFASNGKRDLRHGAPHKRRWVIAGGAVAALTAGLVVLPSLGGGDQAFATWTPTPASISVQQRPEVADECRKSLDETGSEYSNDTDSAEVAIAERRGVWTAVVLAGKDGFAGLCVTDDSSGLFRDMIGSVGTPGGYTAPQPREVVATDLGTGSMDAGEISVAAGFAGTDVADVSYLSSTHGEVKATVSKGHFALWLPGDELDGSASNETDVEVTYNDGTTETQQLSLE